MEKIWRWMELLTRWGFLLVLFYDRHQRTHPGSKVIC